MTAQHTPGPWTAKSLQVWSDKTGYGVAYAQRPIYPTDEEMQIAHANARLIAAAPDLLEALQAIVQSWDNNTFDRERFVKSELGDYWTPAAAMVNSETIAAARAAIARATHKEQT